MDAFNKEAGLGAGASCGVFFQGCSACGRQGDGVSAPFQSDGNVVGVGSRQKHSACVPGYGDPRLGYFTNAMRAVGCANE